MRAKRPCAEPGCPTLTNDTRCLVHARQRDQARGTRQQRGYDAAHQRERARWQALIDSGATVKCATCPTLLEGRAWDLGHTQDRTRYLGPQCIPCNRGTARK